MGEKWIKVRRELPPGILVLDGKHQELVEKVLDLSDEDLLELEAFLEFLNESSGGTQRANTAGAKKIYDFMAGGMQRVG